MHTQKTELSGSGPLPRVTFVLGGARSGKSAMAERLVMQVPPPWAYLATGQAFDDEMAERIALHRGRRSPEWHTYDAPIDLAETLTGPVRALPALVDCLTLWLTNRMLAGHDLAACSTDLMAALAGRTAPTVLVSNEVGLGIVPETPLGRAFRDEAGRLNQRVAAAADRVLFVAAGLPLTLKG